MNRIINTFLLAGDKFMPEMHLKQGLLIVLKLKLIYLYCLNLSKPAFTYSACGPFTKNKERIQKFKETGDTKYTYRNELDKACFQHDLAYGDFKDLVRTAADKILRDKTFNIAKDPKYDGYQRELASMIYRFLIQKLQTVVLNLCHKVNN